MPEVTSILETVTSALGIEVDETIFDQELVLHINSALGTLNQNGIGKPTFVRDYGAQWSDFKDVTQTQGNQMFEQVKTFVFLKTKLLFDPPPPSTIKYLSDAADEILWRLREEYHVIVVPPVEEEV